MYGVSWEITNKNRYAILVHVTLHNNVCCFFSKTSVKIHKNPYPVFIYFEIKCVYMLAFTFFIFLNCDNKKPPNTKKRQALWQFQTYITPMTSLTVSSQQRKITFMLQALDVIKMLKINSSIFFQNLKIT